MINLVRLVFSFRFLGIFGCLISVYILHNYVLLSFSNVVQTAGATQDSNCIDHYLQLVCIDKQAHIYLQLT